MAQPAYVQSVGAAATANVTSLGVTITPTPGNALLAAVLARNGASQVSGPAGWTRVASSIDNNFETSIWALYGYNGSGAQTYTWTQIASDSLEIIIVEVHNLGATSSSALDQVATNTSGVGVASNPVDSGTTATTTQASEFLFAALGSAGTGNRTISGLTSGWTQDLTENSSGATHPTHLTDCYQVVSSDVAANCQFTLSTAQQWNGCVATFKAAGVALGGEIESVTDGSVQVVVAHPLSGEIESVTSGAIDLVVAHQLAGVVSSVTGGSVQLVVDIPPASAMARMRAGTATATMRDGAVIAIVR